MFKKLLQFISVCSISMPFGSSAQNTFQKSVDFGGDDYINAMSPVLPDGSYYVMGSSNATGAGSYDMALSKIDAAGNVLWEKQYGGTGFDGGRNLLLTTDHNIVMVGSTQSFTTGAGYDLFAVKVDPTGTVIWARTFGTNGDDFGYKAIEAPDSGYVFIGQTSGAAKDNNKGEILVIKTDKSGNPAWTKTVGSVAGVEKGWDGFAVGSSGYVVGGQSNLGLIGGTDVEVHLLTPNGNLAVSLLYGGLGDDDARKFAPAKNGLLVAGNSRSFGAPNQGDMFVSYIDGSGGTPVVSFFKNIGSSVDESLSSFNMDAQGNYIGSALVGGKVGGVFGVDTLGNVTWATKYDTITSIMDAQNGPNGVVGAGYTNSYGGTANNMFLVNGKKDGSTPCHSFPWTLPATTVTPTVLGPSISQFTADTLPMANLDVTSTVATHSNTPISTVVCLHTMSQSFFSQSITKCAGKSYTINNHVYTTSGTYKDTLVGANVMMGDSIITTTLMVLNSTHSTQNSSVPFGHSYTYNGHTYTASGIYNDTLVGANSMGCDSIMTTTLTVSPNGISLINANLNSLSVVPNPSLGDVNLVFDMAHAEEIEIKLVDVLGQVVNKFNQNFTEGNNKVKLGTNLETGTYVVYISSPTISSSTKVLVVR